MPRTNGVYSPPAGTKGVPNTTVRSAPYNSFVDDLAQDANAARPITAGGTGATNATKARENLGAIGSTDMLAAPLKETPVDGDSVVLLDSEDNGKIKRTLWSRVKAVLQAFFDNRYLRLTGGTLSGALNILSNTAAFSPLLNLRNSGAGDIAIRMVGGGRNFDGSHIEIGQRANNGNLFLWNGAGVQVTLDKNGTLLATGWIVSDQNIRASGGAVYAGTGDKRFIGDCYDPTVWRDRWRQGDGWAWSGINGQIEARAFWRSEDWAKSRNRADQGTYTIARFRYFGYSRNGNDTISGSELTYAAVASEGSNSVHGGTIDVGTWKLMSSGGNATASGSNQVSLWMRIA